MSEWKHFDRIISCKLKGYRPGLKGVWDHLVEAISSDTSRTFERDHVMTMSFWMKADESVSISSITIMPEQILSIPIAPKAGGN